MEEPEPRSPHGSEDRVRDGLPDGRVCPVIARDIMRDGIANSAVGRLRSSHYAALREVGCTYRDGTLELRGQLPSHYLKQVAQALAMDIEGVTTVTNRIRVAAPPDGPRPRSARGMMPTLSHQVEIVSALGLHLRAAGRFVRLAQQFRAEVRVSCGDRQVDGKSILDLATLAAECGTRLDIEASGPDAAEALAALAALVAARFHEDDECGHPA